MPSSKDYLDFILEQLSDLEDVSWRAMMGGICSTIVEKSSAAFTTTGFS